MLSKIWHKFKNLYVDEYKTSLGMYNFHKHNFVNIFLISIQNTYTGTYTVNSAEVTSLVLESNPGFASRLSTHICSTGNYSTLQLFNHNYDTLFLGTLGKLMHRTLSGV
jgi:hypothetical protein